MLTPRQQSQLLSCNGMDAHCILNCFPWKNGGDMRAAIYRLHLGLCTTPNTALVLVITCNVQSRFVHQAVRQCGRGGCAATIFFSRALQSKENSLGLDADHSSLSLNSMSVQLQSCKVNEWTGKGGGGEGRTEEKKSRTGIPS